MSTTVRARVLLVDDEVEFLESLTQRLELRGLQVRTATSGVEALAVMGEREFDLVIVDLSMPGIDGLETIRRAKAMNPSVEMVILTGHGSIESGVEAMKAGAGDYLQKPVDLGALLEKIVEAKDKRIQVLQEKSQEEVEQIIKHKGW